MSSGNRIIRMSELTKKVGLSRATIYRKLESDDFPRPVSLGKRAVGWKEVDVDDWINERVNA